MTSRTTWRIVAKKAVIVACGLLLAIAAMIVLGVAEGTPEPQNAPPVAPRAPKW